MKVHKINKENFDEVRGGSRPVLLDFYADWCGPCRMVSPIIDEIAEERDDVLVGKVDVDREPELASRFGVYSIPTLIVLRDGNVVSRVSGARPKAQILDMLNA
jgi:thioredoxin 1